MNTPNVDFQCVVCLQLADEALITDCTCMVVICQQCYDKLKSQKNLDKCPLCPKDLKVHVEHLIRRKIRQASQQINVGVVSLTGEKFFVNIKELYPTSILFTRVSEKLKIGVGKFELLLDGKYIENSDKSLKKLKITKDSTLTVGKQIILLSIQQLTGKPFPLIFDPQSTVQVLFKRIQERTGMPIEQMRLVCQAVTLHNPTNDKLKSLGITHKATVSVLKRLKGGNDSIL